MFGELKVQQTFAQLRTGLRSRCSVNAQVSSLCSANAQVRSGCSAHIQIRSRCSANAQVRSRCVLQMHKVFCKHLDKIKVCCKCSGNNKVFHKRSGKMKAFCKSLGKIRCSVNVPGAQHILTCFLFFSVFCNVACCIVKINGVVCVSVDKPWFCCQDRWERGGRTNNFRRVVGGT